MDIESTGRRAGPRPAVDAERRIYGENGKRVYNFCHNPVDGKAVAGIEAPAVAHASSSELARQPLRVAVERVNRARGHRKC